MADTFLIEVRQTGAEATAAAINKIGATAEHATNVMRLFRNALVLFSTLRAAEVAISFADSVNNISNRLRVATNTAEDFARAQKFIFEVSQETRTEVEANAVIYSRLLRSIQSLHIPMKDAESVMTSLTKQIGIGGATSQEAKNALIQFSQAMASGALRGDELRSVVEQLPGLANSIGKEFGVGAGGLAAFGKANPGIITTSRIMKAILADTDAVNKEFEKIKPTMASGFIVISNAAKKLLFDVQANTNAFSLMAQALVFVGQHLALFLNIVVALVAAKLADNVVGMAQAFYNMNNVVFKLVNQMKLLTAAQTLYNAVLIANPLGVTVVAIAALVAAMVLLYQNVPAVAAVMDKFWEILKKLGGYITSNLNIAFQLFGAAINALVPSVTAIWNVLQVLWTKIEPLVTKFYEATGGSKTWGIVLTTLLIPGLTALSDILPIIVAVGLAPLIAGVQLVTNLLHAFGLVTDETTKKINDASMGFYKFAEQAILAPASFAKADEGEKILNKTIDQTKASANAARGGVDNLTGGIKGTGSAAADTTTQLKAMKAAQDALGVNGVAKGINYGAALQQDAGYHYNSNGQLGAVGRTTFNGVPIEGRAVGGSVNAGQTYLIGEHGPELFTAGGKGYITPNTDLVGSSGGETGTTYSSAIVTAAKLIADTTTVATTAVAKSVNAAVGQVSSMAIDGAQQTTYRYGGEVGLHDNIGPLHFQTGDPFSLSGAPGGMGVDSPGTVQTSASSQAVADASAAAAAFKASIPELMKQIPKIDFQTLTPWQGGKTFADNDKFGVGAAAGRANQAYLNPPANNNTSVDNRISLTMSVHTPDAASFRQNQSQIEAQLYGMVQRAAKRKVG